MLTVVCWRWRPPAASRSTFPAEAVLALKQAVARHYPHPHRFVCVTDEPELLDPSIDVVPDWGDFKDIPAPSGDKNPSCYRRLRLFSRDVAAVLGDRFVSLDLDTVITGDLSPVWNRSEDFVMYGDTNPRTFYNGSMVLMTAGARAKVWETFDPRTSIKHAFRAGHHGSDQAWISFCLGPSESKWGTKDGVFSFRNHFKMAGRTDLPPEARLVVFHGLHKPWDARVQAEYPWVRSHYTIRQGVAA
jgi:hypothetical protein